MQTGRTLRDAAVSIITAVPDFFTAFFGPVEITTGEWCAMCQDVHEVGTECPRALIGLCASCDEWRDLDHYGNCPFGHSTVTRRKSKHETSYMKALRGERA